MKCVDCMIWLRKETDVKLLWTKWWPFVFHKIRAISWRAEKLLTSLECLCCMELFIDITIPRQLAVSPVIAYNNSVSMGARNTGWNLYDCIFVVEKWNVL